MILTEFMLMFLFVCLFFLEEEVELPDVDYLRTMTHIVFVDFDNWSNFFGHLPGHLNQGTFIWGFQGMVKKESTRGPSSGNVTQLKGSFEPS